MAKKKYDLITDLVCGGSEGSNGQSGKLDVFPALCLPELPSAF